MSGYCVSGKHGGCPDSAVDTYTCSCPCHIDWDTEDEVEVTYSVMYSEVK